MNLAEFERSRQFVPTAFGEIAYVERGDGPVALFLHGYPLNGYQWRDIIDRLSDVRRCVALDLMSAGHTRISEKQDLTYTAQASMVEAFLNALEIDRIDLVGSDSGGAVSQIFAANAPERIRSLTLTNCEVHDVTWPPPPLEAMVASARSGTLKDRLKLLLGDLDRCRTAFAIVYEHAEQLADETLRAYLQPLVASDAAGRNTERFIVSINNRLTTAIEDKLRRLDVPTLVLWGAADTIFPVKWAHWLKNTIPGVRNVIELPGAKMWFPEERPEFINRHLRQHWMAASSTASVARAAHKPVRSPSC